MIGKSISQYEITELLGQGGMGVVYKALDARLGRSVAIKMLPAQLLESPELMVRLEREARTLAALNHPNIGSIHDIVDHEGKKYLVLEYVDGDTLADRIARRRLRVGEALDVGSQIASGLAAAHDAGFVHRDLKPANVKLTTEGGVKVLDFGLACTETKPGPFVNESSTEVLSKELTSPGAVLGTMQYMSPEQVRGEQTDRRTDLWSLGVVLYQCLTGSSPFARESVGDCIAATLTEEPNLDNLPATTPGEVVSLIRRCLRKDPLARQRDAGDCHLVLEDARDALLHETSAPLRLVAITDRRFVIGDDLCRDLDRREFDALLPGWEMLYADNNRESDVLILWIPSLGGDHTTTQWRDLIAASPHRMVIVTPVGMEPGVQDRPVVSLSSQLALIRALTRHLRSSLDPRKCIISGFSCGSIMALRCAAGDETGELFDSVLAIDPDLEERDCFMTRLFAELDASSSRDVMKGLSKLSSSCATVDEWLVLHQHMVECVDKVQADFSPLIRQGKDLSEAYEGVHCGADSPFPGFLRDALTRVATVRCAFHDSPRHRRILGEIRMLHLDREILGPRFTDEVLSFLPVPDHIGMMSNERLLEEIDRIVETE